MVGAVARRAMAVLPAIVAWQEPVERVEGILVGTGPELHDHEARRGVRHEDREQAVAAGGMFRDEPPARCGQVGEASVGTRSDREPERLYGKMLRRASRRRPSPPIAGADS